MRHPAAIVLDALLEGQRVVIGPYDHGIELDEGNRIAMPVTQFEGGVETEVLFGVDDYTLSQFIRDCNKLTRNEVVIISANTVSGKS